MPALYQVCEKRKEKTPSYNLQNILEGKRKKGKLDQTVSDFGAVSSFVEVKDGEGSYNETSSDKEKEALTIIRNIMEKEDVSTEGDLLDTIHDILQSATENKTEFSSVKTKIRNTIQVGQKKEIKPEVFSKVLLFLFFFILPLCIIVLTLYTIITGRRKIEKQRQSPGN
jgi:hypothetical protein